MQTKKQHIEYPNIVYFVCQGKNWKNIDQNVNDGYLLPSKIIVEF